MTREELNKAKQQEIFEDVKHEKRKKFTIIVFKFCVFIVISFVIFYLYTTFISSKLLSVNEYRVINNKLPASFNGMKVVHFSDLHYGTTVFEKELQILVNEINDRNPDLVIFTGDLIDANYKLKTDEQEHIIEIMKNIEASLGKYAIFGEEDGETFHTIMKEGDFVILQNSYDLIYNNDSVPILLVGLDSSLDDKSNLSDAFSYFNDKTHNSNIFTMALTHEPDVSDSILSNYSSDMILSGHSHNGSIRLPFIGGLYKVNGAKKYYDAYYKINNTDLYISGGIGSNGPGFRLFCRPSFNFFRISNK